MARSLLDVLREDHRLTGPKPGCGEGACGACTVLLDGEPVRACVTPASAVAGRSVTTPEAMRDDPVFIALRRAFVQDGAVQCGYCTPGMVVSAAALLARNVDPDPATVRAALAGNVCRCCAYPRIERAVLHAARVLRDDQPGDDDYGDGLPKCVSFWDFRPQAPWDLAPLEQREYFELLGDGLMVVLPPGQREGRRSGFAPFGGGAWLHIGTQGDVTAFTGKVDIGQDNATSLAMIVADELEVRPAAVRLVMGDTDLCPADPGTFGSRSLPDAGEDLRCCAATARETLTQRDRPLLDEREIVIASTDVALRPPSAWSCRGRSSARIGAHERVDGTQVFPSDVFLSGMLYGCLLRPPAYGAALSSVSCERARSLPGVVVVEQQDLVAVAAPDLATARRALQLIDAEWQAAAQPDERQLVEHLRSHPVEVLGWERAVVEEEGALDAAISQAAVKLEATYTTAYVAHAALETRVAVARWDDGRLTVWTGTQQPFFVRYALAAAFGLTEEQVRVIVPAVGGGFGSKHTEEESIAAATLARAAGAPVRVALSREEEFRFTFARPAAVIDVRSGAGRDGRIDAWELCNINSGSAALTSPYRARNRRESFQPADSPVPQGPYRALAATANNFARESHIDEIAHALGLDPLDLRLRNLDDERLMAVLGACAKRAGWDERRHGDGEGMGIACGVEKDGRVATCAHVRVDRGALEIVRITTAYECGAIVNPDNVERQIEGATIMGLGGALFEALHFQDGRILNASMSTYRLPRFTDVPPIDVVVLDRPELPSAGAGETPIIAIAPALANAIFAATGNRIRSLPLWPG